MGHRSHIFVSFLILMALVISSSNSLGLQINQVITVKVGLLTPQTGGLSAYSQGFENAANLAIADINANSSFSSYNFQLTTYDTQTTPTGALNVATQAVFDGMDYLVGAAGSSNTLAAAAVAASNGIPIISYASTSPALTLFDDHAIAGDQGYLWRIPPSDAQQGKAISDLLIDNSFSSIVIIHLDNAYGSGLANSARDNVIANGGSVYLIPYSQTTTDFSAIVSNAAAQNPSAIVMISYTTDGAYLLNELALQNVDVPIIGADGIADPSMYTVTPDVNASIQGVVATKPTAANTPEHTAFMTEYSNAYPGALGDIYIAETYDAVWAGALAILNASSTLGSDIIAHLSTLSFNGASDHISFDVNGDSTAGHYSYAQFRNTQLVTVASWYFNQITYDYPDIFTWTSLLTTNVKIGFLAPFTGGLSLFAQGFLNAATLAVNTLNSDPTFSGYSFTLQTYDTMTTTAGATAAATQAITDGVSFIVGAAASTSTLSAAQVAVGSQIPIISYASTSPRLTSFDDHAIAGDAGYLWRIPPSDALQGKAISDLLIDNSVTSILVIHVSDIYGNMLNASIQDNFISSGGTVLQEVQYDPATVDFPNLVNSITGYNPDVIILVSYAPDGAAIIDEMSIQNIDIPVLGADGIASAGILTETPSISQSIQGVVASKPEAVNSPMYTSFITNYNNAYPGSSGDIYLAESYDAVWAGALAIQYGGSTSGPNIIASLSTLSFAGASAQISFDINGDSYAGNYNFYQFQNSGLNLVANWYQNQLTYYKQTIFIFPQESTSSVSSSINVPPISSPNTQSSSNVDTTNNTVTTPTVPLNYQTNLLFTMITLIWFTKRRKRVTK